MTNKVSQLFKKKKESVYHQDVASEEMRLKSRPVVENSIEFDYELYKSNWPDLFDGHLDHIIEDMKGGNLTKGAQEQEVNHLLRCATMCNTWHHNPAHKLLRSKALFVSDAAIQLGVSMSRDAKFFDGIRTVREKKHETRKMDQKNSMFPSMKKKEEEQW